MKIVGWLMLLLWMATAGNLRAQAVPDEIRLAVGDARVLMLDLKRAALGDGQIVSLSTPERGQLLVIGGRRGMTTAQCGCGMAPSERCGSWCSRRIWNAIQEVRRLLEG